MRLVHFYWRIETRRWPLRRKCYRYRSSKLLIHPVDRHVYTMQRAISKLPVGHQRLRTIYRDVTREPFRLHPSAFPPENFFNSCRFHLLASHEFAWLLILLQTFCSRAYSPERLRVWIRVHDIRDISTDRISFFLSSFFSFRRNIMLIIYST